MASKPAVIKRLINDFAGRRPMRATSLIITLFGDVVSQHGGTIWLGSLVRALALLGVSERLVRTSVFRLAQEGWLECERAGRRSFYRFSAYGEHEYERAARRIYALQQTRWDGRWQLLIPLEVAEVNRERFKRSLHWQGFRSIASGTFAKPGDGGSTLRETLQEFAAADKVVLLQADTLPPTSPALVRKLVRESWRLEDVAHGYRDFLARFKPLLKRLQGSAPLAPEDAFIARTLLIHDYRRLLLQDTIIPAELLPGNWPGARARVFTARIYRLLAPASVQFISAELEAKSGAVAPPGAGFHERFGPLHQPGQKRPAQ